MKHALIALDPVGNSDQNLEHFCEVVKLFQDKGFFSETSIVSVIHPSLYLLPNQWFRDMKGKLAKDALESIADRITDRFRFSTVKILQSYSDSMESLVSVLSRYARRAGSDVLVVASNDRAGFPLWFLGSFSETASLIAVHPILIIKPHMQIHDFGQEPRLVVGIDTTVPITTKALHWITDSARSVSAFVDLIHVKPRPRAFRDAFQKKSGKKEPELVLQSIQKKLQKSGLRVGISVLEESTSIAHALVDFAEQRQAWVIIAVAAQRSPLRKLLLGSNARRILSLTRRPFLSLRLD